MRDDITRMAREAGFHAWYTQPEEHPDHVAIIERFHQLAVAAEREACARLCDELQSIPATEPRHCAEDIRARRNK